jgi:putative PIN family toxin of toxin-antitoxin system
MRVVADTNVLVAAVLAPDGRCGRLLLAATEGRWSLVASPRLLDELAEVLSRRKFRRWLTAEDAQAFVSAVSRLAEVHDDPPCPASITRDPDDDYLLALAIAAEAEAIVTGDDDLAALDAPPVPVLTPAELLSRLHGS